MPLNRTPFVWCPPIDIAAGEIPADPVCDFDTRNNCISVYIVDSDTRTIEQLAAAFTATRGNLKDFEYVTFDLQDVTDSGIEIVEAGGTTPDAESNRLHRNLVEISAQKLVALTTRILRQGVATSCDRVNRKVVATHIVRGLKEGWLDADKVNSHVLESAKKEVDAS